VVCNATGNQYSPAAAADGSGGLLLAWLDERYGAGVTGIFAQRLTAVGALAPNWVANGMQVAVNSGVADAPNVIGTPNNGILTVWADQRVSAADPNVYASMLNAQGNEVGHNGGNPLCTQTAAQTGVSLVADGSGGAIVAWADARSGNSDIYAQHVTGSDAVAPGWPVDGLLVCGATSYQDQPVLASDGVGGAIVAWRDYRSGVSADLYATRVTSSGALAAGWDYNGTVVCGAQGEQANPAIVSDGAGGALVSWLDRRINPGGLPDVYTQRIDGFGKLGNAEPFSAGVRDVPLDQGGHVKVSWTASYLDADPVYGITEYRVWRSVPPAAASGATALRRGTTTDADLAAATGELLVTPFSAAAYAWELVATEPAAALPFYAVTTTTNSDSVGAGNPRTAFMIEARQYAYVGSAHWFSAPDSGYSVDNLPPVIPAPFAATYAAGSARLTWSPNTEPDFALYRLYRGGSAAFVPGPTNLVVSKPDTGYVDAAGGPYWYKLVAEDSHGNRSPVATALPAGTAGVGEGAPLALVLAPARGNPSRGRELLVAFTLPSAAAARLELLDVTGRRIASRDVGALGAGQHVVDLAADGRIAPGLYLVRLAQAGKLRTTRVAVLD
jgi:hypothetical protein